MDEIYKNVVAEFHLQNGKPSASREYKSLREEDIPLIGIFLISNIRKSCQLISQYTLTSRVL